MTCVRTAIALIFVITTLSANSQSCDCGLGGYIIDQDTTGTNMRDQPNGKIIKTLPFKGRCQLATPVTIHKSDKNWCYVTTHDICVETATGWVHSSLLYTRLQFHTTYNEKTKQYYTLPISLFESADTKSKLTFKVYLDHEVHIQACCDGWVLTEVIEKGQTKKGWLRPEDQCSNPFTNCN